MKRLIISLLLLMAIASMTALEARSTIEFGNEWHLYVANVGSNGIFLGVDKTTVGEYTYFVDMRNDQYLYRQDDRKVYRYSVATQEEDLVLDFGLQVNDVFTHHDGSQWVVESLSDTTVLYYGMYGSQLCMHLRNSESSQADTWIEGIGSLHYGINPPEDMAVIDQYHLLSFAQWDWGSYIFEFIEDNISCKKVIGDKVEWYEGEDFINFSLKNNKLYVDGGMWTDSEGCLGPMLVVEKEGVIDVAIYPIDHGLDQWIFCTYSVEFDNFTQSQYEVFFEGKSVGTVSPEERKYLAQPTENYTYIYVNEKNETQIKESNPYGHESLLEGTIVGDKVVNNVARIECEIERELFQFVDDKYLVFDYGMQVGDSLNVVTEILKHACIGDITNYLIFYKSIEVQSIETKVYNGVERLCYNLKSKGFQTTVNYGYTTPGTEKPREEDYFEEFSETRECGSWEEQWIEGIGYTSFVYDGGYDPLSRYMLQSVAVEGEEIYSSNPMNQSFTGLTDGSKWTFYGELMVGSYIEGDYYMEQVVRGDTIIEDCTYKKVYEREIWDKEFKPGEKLSLLCQEGSKIYEWRDNKRVLNYDFDLQAGDEFYIAFDDKIVVDKVEYKTMPNGRLLKHLYVSLQLEDRKINDVWIEGIGSMTDGLNQCNLGDVGARRELISFISQGEEYLSHTARQNSETLFTNSTSWSELARTMDSAHIYDYYIANDTIVGGKIYKVVCCKQTGGKTLLHISPDNNKVYRHDANSDKLIYDFGDWYVGKSILSDNYMSDDMLPDAVADCSIDHIGVMQDYDGRELEYMTLSLTLRNGEVIPTNDPILRGIGSTTGILYGDFDYVVMPDGSSNELISFSIYGSTVYNRGYKAYPFNYIEKSDELQPATAVWKGDSITITGTICAEWGEENRAAALVEGDEIRVVLTNTSLRYDNANYNHKYALTIDASNVTAEEVTIFIEPVAEYVTVAKSGIAKNKVLPFTLHRNGDVLIAVFPAAGAGEAITLYDATGRVVAVQPISEGATTASIDVANLPKGIYIARLNSGASAKVVK